MLETTSDAVWVAGVDGCPGGWLVVGWQPSTGIVARRVASTFEAVLRATQDAAYVGVDMVIGLPDVAQPGGRTCDRDARALLGHPRSSSVFSPPVAEALAAQSHKEASAINRASGPDAPGLTIQAWHLIPKMRAVQRAMSPARQERIREVHPECAFYALNDDAPMAASKHTADGRSARARLLRALFPSIEDAMRQYPTRVAAATDVLDAHAVCAVAGAMHEGDARRVPRNPSRNNRGLRMEIWY
ncbi:DUF429 domain-containing protein [Salisaeta longa]|uniref:DUF429 domain-containing protein n=1 Tax=Salisaeta longa TaxID=503170 RepID=UPI0003B5EE9C|nr:DUF429 domain-containing protein [Salisaeta longa]